MRSSSVASSIPAGCGIDVLDRVLPERLKSLQQVSGLPVVFGGWTEPTPAGQQLRISRLVGTLGTSLRGLRVPAGRGLGGAVLSQRVPHRVNGYASADKITHDYDDIVVREERMTSVLAVPVIVGGTVLGVLYGAVRDPRPIGDRAMHAALVIAGQLQRELEPCTDEGASRRSALDELAEVISQTQDEAMRARLLRIYSELRGDFAGRGAAAAGSGSSLSPREVDVLRLVAVGASNLEIAAELRLSPETVKAYLKAAMQKLGARNRTGAVHAGRLAGVL